MPQVLPEPLIRGPIARPAAMVCALALALLAAAFAARLIWAAMGLFADPVPPPTPMSVEQLTAEAEAGAVNAVSQWHLFGVGLPARDTRSLASTAPDTGLQLTLRGIFAADDPKLGRAIIAAPGGADRGYSVGQEVSPGVSLDAVYPDRVMLLRDGALEALRLPRADGGVVASAPGTGSAAVAGPGQPRNTVPMRAVPVDQPPGAAQPFVNPVMSLGGVDWNKTTQGMNIDVAALAQQVQLLPVMENGQFVGVRLSAGPQQAMLEKLGLRPDDIVTAVNGQSITDPSRIQGIVAGLSTASRVSVQIRRNGKTETLTLAVPR
jgi:general secretion pathway protein C